MTEQVRCWLVDRELWDEDVVTLVYATPDGERYYKRQLSSAMVVRGTVTAARSVPADELEPVRDDADRDRYASEARRMAEVHEPDDGI